MFEVERERTQRRTDKITLWTACACMDTRASWIGAQGANEGAAHAAAGAQHRCTIQLISRWDWLPGLRPLVGHVLIRQVQILYLDKKTDDGLEMLERIGSRYPSLDNDPRFHNWYGNLLFQRTIVQKDITAMLDGFSAALREYQKALELDGNSWDARYNFELMKRILTISEADDARNSWIF